MMNKYISEIVRRCFLKMDKTVESDKDQVRDERLEAGSDTAAMSGGGLKRMALNDTKAGMEGLDTDRINQIIEDVSKGSKFYIHQQKAQEKLNSRIQCLLQAYKNLGEVQIQRSVSLMNSMSQKMEDERVLNRTIVHVDMDAYFAAVEMRDNPDLRNVPMAVGGDSMLSTSNYLARRFGVRAGLPGFIAKKLCPELVVVPGNYEKYSKVSREIQEVFAEYDPNFSSVSLDEAYLDITDYLENKNQLKSDTEMLTPEEVTNEIREKIFLRTQLTASAGIACNSLLAKICGDINKPNGQYYLRPSVPVINEFIDLLPIRKVSGIGNVTEQLLNSLNIYNCGDLWEHRGIINLLFKPATASFLLSVALGIGNSWFSVADPTEHQKSISSERTFSGPGTNIEPHLCQNLCMDLERELISKELKARTVTLKIKTVNFEVKTRAVNLLMHTNESDIIFETAWGIYKSYLNEVKDLAIRLLGVRLSNFQSSNGEAIELNSHNNSLALFKPKKQERIDHLLLKLKEKEVSEDYNPKYECPVCLAKFHEYKKLEYHVEECLSPSNIPEDTRNRGKIDNSHSFPKPCSSKSGLEARVILTDISKEQAHWPMHPDFIPPNGYFNNKHNAEPEEQFQVLSEETLEESEWAPFPPSLELSNMSEEKKYSFPTPTSGTNRKPYSVNGNKRRRNDSLGKNRKITDYLASKDRDDNSTK